MPKHCLSYGLFLLLNIWTLAGYAQGLLQLSPSWHYPLYSAVSASPVVADNHLLVAAENGNLYAFDLTTKEPRWLYHTQGGIGSTPAVANGRVYFLSRDGFFYALELTSGKLLWRFATKGEQRFAALGGYGLPLSLGPIPDPWDFYLSSPLVQGDLVYFGSSDRHVYALSAATGSLIWSFKADDLVHSSPAYADGTIYIGTWGTKLYALNATTGKEQWRFQGKVDPERCVMQGITAAPTVDGDTVYIGARDGFFYAIQRKDGKLKWSYDAAGTWVLSTAAVDNTRVYFGTSDTGLLLALDKTNGAEQFRTNTKVWTYASPLLVGEDLLVTATMSGELYGVDRHSGTVRWHYQTPQGRRDSADIIDDTTGKLRPEKLFAPGRQLQASVEQVKALGAFIASPIWVDGQLIAVSATGDLVIFNL
jgi:outer membrane protein assembly factor BamB